MHSNTRIVMRIMAVVMVFKAAAAPPARAQSISNQPGVIMGLTAGRATYRDDSGSTNRREVRLRGGYRLCVACAGLGERLRLMPFLSLAITDLAGLSHTGRDEVAFSSLDAGAAAVINVTGPWRVEVAGAVGLKSSAERFTSRRAANRPGADFVNLSGSGARRYTVQVERACAPLAFLGRRTLVFGYSRSNGAYDSYELRGETRSLPRATNHRANSIWLGVQSRLLLSDCER